MQYLVSRVALVSVLVVNVTPSGALAQAIVDISPASSSSSAKDAVGAPLTLTVFGTSFNSTDEIEVGGRDCPAESQNVSQIVCTLPEVEGADLRVDPPCACCRRRAKDPRVR